MIVTAARGSLRILLLMVSFVAFAANAAAQFEFGSAKPLPDDDPLRPAIAARGEGDPVILFDPPVADFGPMVMGELKWQTIRIANAFTRPVTILKAVPSGSVTVSGLPVRLTPFEYVDFSIGFRAPWHQGLDLHKRMTFQVKVDPEPGEGSPGGVEILVYGFVGRVIEAIRVEPEIVRAPDRAELLRQRRRGPTLDVGFLAPGNAYDVRVLVTNDSPARRTITSIRSDVHDVPGWIDGPDPLEPGESRCLHLPYLASRFGRPFQQVEEGWIVRFDDGGEERLVLRADLGVPPVLHIEPESLELGELSAGEAVKLQLRAVNVSGRPIRITKVVPGRCGILPRWPVDPIAPGEAVVIEDVCVAPPAAGEARRIRWIYTLQFEDAHPQRVEFRGTVRAASPSNGAGLR